MNDNIKAVKSAIMTYCKLVRKRHEVTQKRMTELTGVSDSAFSLFENGRFSFDIAWLYYAHIMSECERNYFQSLIVDLKNKYLDV